MRKSIAFAAALAALMGGATLAAAQAAPKLYGPQPIPDVRLAGEGIVVGTVVDVDRNGFVLADAGDRIRVRWHGAAETVKPGQQATVAGRMDDGELKVEQIVDEGGTSLQRQHRARHGHDEARRDRRDDRHGRDDDRRRPNRHHHTR